MRSERLHALISELATTPIRLFPQRDIRSCRNEDYQAGGCPTERVIMKRLGLVVGALAATLLLMGYHPSLRPSRLRLSRAPPGSTTPMQESPSTAAVMALDLSDIPLMAGL